MSFILIIVNIVWMKVFIKAVQGFWDGFILCSQGGPLLGGLEEWILPYAFMESSSELGVVGVGVYLYVL